MLEAWCFYLTTPRLDHVAVIAPAIMNADNSATPVASVTQPFGFQERLNSVFGDLPEIFNKADIVVRRVSMVYLL